jgi:ribosomal protein S18 acetylase RimI-like enzyme
MTNRPDEFIDKKLNIISLRGDREREKALRRRNFSRERVYGILRIRETDSSIPGVIVPEGFTIRSVDGRKDFQKLASNIRIVFGHGEWFTAEILERIAEASFYVKDLDLIAEAPNGDIASFCTFRIDPISNAAELEPIGTLPEYRGLGLAKALMIEGIKRLKKYQPLFIYIDGAADTPAANRLYETMGFENRGTYYYWSKNII